MKKTFQTNNMLSDRSIRRRSFIRNMTLAGIGASGLSSVGSVRADESDSFTGDSPEPADPNKQNLLQEPFINVKTFGAKGNNLDDDRPAIQAAIDAIRNTGGCIFIPPGTYRLSLNPDEELGIKIYSNMHLMGAGRGNTILKWLDDVTTASQHYLLACDGGFVENVTISDFEIDGNKQNRGTETFHIRGEGIEMDGNNISIRNMYIHDVLGEGIDCDASDGFFISHVVVENTGGNGIHCSDARVRNVMISHCITRNCAHGRKKSGNIRYGGLVLRGSDIYVNHHISVGDSQIANIEGQGREEHSEIVLSHVTGRSLAEDAEGFRVGMKGQIVLSHCRSNLPHSGKENFQADAFEGTLQLDHCYAETFDGTPWKISMKGTFSMDACTAKVYTENEGEHGYHLQIDGRVVLRKCELSSSQTHNNGFFLEGNLEDVDLEHCRYINPYQFKGHGICIILTPSEDPTPEKVLKRVCIQGGEFFNGASDDNTIQCVSSVNAEVQIRALKRCHGGGTALYINRTGFPARLTAVVSGNHLEGGAVSLHLGEGLAKGFVTGNVCKQNIHLEGTHITCVNNGVPNVTDKSRNNTTEPNFSW